ncbi:MAG TPA: hypothetical protein VFG45_01050 [Candidatus Nitrosocosmicus sp.]|nr:hypothetical protein [Candidatus Nitrosocosmicus sp.]
MSIASFYGFYTSEFVYGQDDSNKNMPSIDDTVLPNQPQALIVCRHVFQMLKRVS